MMRAELDHLVVVAPTLAIGADFVTQALGVEPQAGGAHPLMGAHNLVLRLGGNTYLEVIAIDPAAPRPKRPRWFALDELPSGASPRLLTWVARTSGLDEAADLLAPYVGNVEAMTRGSLRWRITVPADGSLARGGLIPSLIEWQTAAHPAINMRESGCSLSMLEAYHSQSELVREQLGRLGLDGALKVTALRTATSPYLVAHIDTPTGRRLLAA